MSLYFFSVLAKCKFLPASSKDTPDEKKCDNPMKTDFGLQINGSVRCGFDAELHENLASTILNKIILIRDKHIY